jgi:archaellin
MLPDDQKKAIMGVGMLLLFVSTILVSAVAAGVLIRATGLMEESAVGVANEARDRLISGIDVFTLYGYGNTTASRLDGIEMYVRLRSGSPPLQLENMGLSYVAGQDSFEAELNESLIGEGCTFGNLTSREDYCYRVLNGNNNTILQTGELLAVRYSLGDGDARLKRQEDFEISLQVKETGSVNTVTATVPDLILDSKIRLR